uniref:Solute carrier family 15 member 1-like n=1 Tax=Stegastes partitus TaxID=144197 RepID=A0A3B5BCZ8_9TELE
MIAVIIASVLLTSCPHVLPFLQQASIAGYPISIFFIVVNEFCERFSYYGMRAVHVLYGFMSPVYLIATCLTPHLSLLLAVHRTIVYLSIVYALGQVVMAVSAIHDITDTNRDGTPDNMTLHVALSMLGLILIALGTGGIKPCVAAFGGDQFQDDQEKQRSTFFSIFYLSINAGSLLSTLITPILRAQECGIYTKQECYPLAFGVPAALMVVSLLVFIVGSGMYNKTAPQGNIMVKVCKCIAFAISNRFRHRSSVYPKRHHWMDWAEERYDKLLIAQVKMVLKVLFLYIPLPMFWALFDQQGSRWTLQATTMNGNFGLLTIMPDQMQTVNPILILVLVPVVDSIVYPLIAKCRINFTPLKRMNVGMFLAGLAFVAAALVQLQIDVGVAVKHTPAATSTHLTFIKPNSISLLENLLGCFHGTPTSTSYRTQTLDYLTFDEPFHLNLGPGANYPISVPDGTRNTIIIVQDAVVYGHINFKDFAAKPDKGANAIRFLNGFHSALNVTLGEEQFGNIVNNNMSQYVNVSQGLAKFQIKNDVGDVCMYEQTLGFGSSFTMVIPSTFAFGPNCADTIRPIMDISPNSVHMALQIPQYFFMTAGEVVFSVTGLEFSYSQAPSNMKSVLQAGWLLTVAVGNIIVLIVAEAATLEDQWAEYLLFASLLVFVCIVFSFMAYFYKYIDPTKIEAQFTQLDPEEKEKRKSLEMTRKESHGGGRKGSDSSSDNEKVKQTRI